MPRWEARRESWESYDFGTVDGTVIYEDGAPVFSQFWSAPAHEAILRLVDAANRGGASG